MCGLVECDIHVPDHLSSKFSEMALILTKNRKLTYGSLWSHEDVCQRK